MSCPLPTLHIKLFVRRIFDAHISHHEKFGANQREELKKSPSAKYFPCRAWLRRELRLCKILLT